MTKRQMTHILRFLLLCFAVVMIVTKSDFLPDPLPPDTASTAIGERFPDVPVLRVIDGDTIDVLLSGEKTRVRLIGVDTPETVDPRRAVGCFGKEASQFASSTLSGAVVSLVVDPTQGEVDKYGRRLFYVYLSDGTLFNEAVIRAGYGLEYTYQNTRYRFQHEFRSAQEEAEREARGLWAPGVCRS